MCAELLGVIERYVQGDAQGTGQIVKPIEHSIHQASANWLHWLRKSYCTPWSCLTCGLSNPASNPICWQCRNPPGHYSPQPSPETLILPDSVEISPGMWQCPKPECLQIHPVSEKFCPCGYRRLNLNESKEEKSTENIDNATVIRVKEELWSCVCRYEYNQQYMERCQVCQTPRPGLSPKDTKVPGKWKCPHCQIDYRHDQKDCTCGYNRETQTMNGQFWTCRGCHFASNTTQSCRICTLKRGNSNGQSQEGKKYDTCLNCRFANPVGQACICWDCKVCGKTTRKEICEKCNVPKGRMWCGSCGQNLVEEGSCAQCVVKEGRQQ